MTKKICFLYILLVTLNSGFANEPLLSYQVQLSNGALINLNQRHFELCKTLVGVHDLAVVNTPIPLGPKFITQEAMADLQILMDQQTQSSLKQCIGGLSYLRLAHAALTADYLGVEPYQRSDESSANPIDTILELFARKIVAEKPIKTWADWFAENWFFCQQAQFKKALELIATDHPLSNAVARKIIDQVPFIHVSTISNEVFDTFFLADAWFGHDSSELITNYLFAEPDHYGVFDIKNGQLVNVINIDYASLPPFSKKDESLSAKVGRYPGDNLASPYKGDSLMVVPRKGGILEIFDSRREQPVKVQTLQAEGIELRKSRLSSDELSLASISLTTSSPRTCVLSVWQRGKKAFESKGGDVEAATIAQAAALYQEASCKQIKIAN